MYPIAGRNRVVSSGYDSSSTTRSRAAPWSRIASRIVQWRNWKLAVKLTAVALVPLAFALALGTLQVQGQVRQSDEYQRLERTVNASTALRTATDRLEKERTTAVQHLTHQPPNIETTPDSYARTDRLLTQGAEAVRRQDLTGSAALHAADGAIRHRLAELPGLRQQVGAGRIDPTTAVHTYSNVVGSLVSLNRALISQISSPELSSTAIALHDLSGIRTETALQHALVLTQLSESSDSTTAKDLAASETRRVNDQDEFRVAATPQQRIEYERIVGAPAALGRQASLQASLDSSPRGGRVSTSVPPQLWTEQSETTSTSLGTLEKKLDDQLHQRAFALHDQASNTAGGESVLLVSALILAGAVVVLIGRQLLGSLKALRNSALNTADTQLPRAVANIRAGSSVAIEQIPVTTSEEFGQVARAFDAVQTQAVTLASEQSELRKSYGDSFVNVSRRSQSLLERQLRLFEQLERDEEDPDQLATLFQLDHLATRMRRNNENLMVLSGADLTRRFQQPATPADLVRAAVSEIEHYPRVVVQPLPEAKVVGYVASDLVRLLAELLDNAANFSAPTTNVVVSGYRRGDGSIGIDIVDRGIGMSDDELAEANRRVASGGQIELSTSRRMGLFVVARLAGRHGIAVELQGGPNTTGMHTSVLLRNELILESEGGAQPAAPTHGVAQQVGVPSRPERVEEPIDWAAIGRGAAEPPKVTRNGFYLVDSSSGSSDAASEASEAVGESAPVSGAAISSVSSGEGLCAEETADEADTPAMLFDPTERELENGFGVAAEHGGGTAPTPIFDDLASAWFRASEERWEDGGTPQTPTLPTDDSKGTFHANLEGKFPYSQQEDSAPPTTPHRTQPSNPAQQPEPNWEFPADDAQRRAEEVSAAQPGQHTSAGLPLRVPKEHLVAGHADSDNTYAPDQARRDPEVTRNRLKAFQYGRHRYTNRRADPSSQHAESTDTDWLLRTDKRAEQVESVLESGPAEYTTAGLPQRTPRAQLAPGKAMDSGDDADSAGSRDAQLIRGRLASFQQGVREGKHNPRNN